MNTGRSRKRSWLGALAALALAGMLAACAAPTPADYAAEKPVLDLRRYFDGDLTAYGIFTDRSGKVVKRFTVRMTARWQGDEGVLDEAFTYSDGSTERRVWRLRKLADEQGVARYTGQADDVVGSADGHASGNALRWTYTLRLPLDGRTVDVQFDDWMFLVDERVMLNRAVMSKFGFYLGEVTLSFIKHS
jgi:Protein of unknown function (DUF3833)